MARLVAWALLATSDGAGVVQHRTQGVGHLLKHAETAGVACGIGLKSLGAMCFLFVRVVNSIIMHM